MRKFRSGLSGVLSFGVAVGVLASTAAAQEFEWRYFTYFPANDKPTQLTRAFAQDVEAATDGRLKITIFTAGELPYKAADVVRSVATNQVQMGDVAVGFASGDVPELNVLSMPFLCTSFEEFEAAASEIAPTVAAVMQEKFDIVAGVQWTMPPQNLWLNREIASLDEISGLKVRTWNPEQVEMIKLLGGSPVSITSAEVIPALERRTIDGAITSALSANDWRAYDIVKTGYMVNMTMGHQMMLVNGEEFGKLPEDIQTILRGKFAEWGPKYNAMSQENEQLARKNLGDNGVNLVTPSKDDMDKAGAALQPLWQTWAEQNGKTGRTLLDAAMKVCGPA